MDDEESRGGQCEEDPRNREPDDLVSAVINGDEEEEESEFDDHISFRLAVVVVVEVDHSP